MSCQMYVQYDNVTDMSTAHESEAAVHSELRTNLQAGTNAPCFYCSLASSWIA